MTFSDAGFLGVLRVKIGISPFNYILISFYQNLSKRDMVYFYIKNYLCLVKLELAFNMSWGTSFD